MNRFDVKEFISLEPVEDSTVIFEFVFLDSQNRRCTQIFSTIPPTGEYARVIQIRLKKAGMEE